MLDEKRLANVLYCKYEMATVSDILDEAAKDQDKDKDEETEVEKETKDAPAVTEIEFVALGQPSQLSSSALTSQL